MANPLARSLTSSDHYENFPVASILVPARLRRPGAAVLEIDDEDPVFEHLEYTSFAREYDLPRASGQ